MQPPLSRPLLIALPLAVFALIALLPWCADRLPVASGAAQDGAEGCCEAAGEKEPAGDGCCAEEPKSDDEKPPCCPTAEEAGPSSERTVTIEEIPDVRVVDQDGVEHSFRTDLVADRTVVINFFFTTCKTICPPLTATFAKVQQELGPELGDGVRLLSISVDPTNDRPARLKRFARTFGAAEGWSFLTGEKQTIDRLLVALGSATPDKFDHTPMVLVGNLATGEWRRTYGLAPASEIAEVVRGVHARAQVGIESRLAKDYFPNRPLIDQHGTPVRFYEDLLQGRTVVLHVMFTRCTSICPPMLTNISKVAELLGDRLGERVQILSLTVDPEFDTPEKLREYSLAFGSREGWRFLTGDREDVRAVLQKLGAWVDDPEAHNAWLIVGNEATGDWRKVLATSPPMQITHLVRSILGEGDALESPSEPRELETSKSNP